MNRPDCSSLCRLRVPLMGTMVIKVHQLVGKLKANLHYFTLLGCLHTVPCAFFMLRTDPAGSGSQPRELVDVKQSPDSRWLSNLNQRGPQHISTSVNNKSIWTVLMGRIGQSLITPVDDPSDTISWRLGKSLPQVAL